MKPGNVGKAWSFIEASQRIAQTQKPENPNTLTTSDNLIEVEPSLEEIIKNKTQTPDSESKMRP